jgi:hypothetical protein
MKNRINYFFNFYYIYTQNTQISIKIIGARTMMGAVTNCAVKKFKKKTLKLIGQDVVILLRE